MANNVFLSAFSCFFLFNSSNCNLIYRNNFSGWNVFLGESCNVFYVIRNKFKMLLVVFCFTHFLEHEDWGSIHCVACYKNCDIFWNHSPLSVHPSRNLSTWLPKNYQCNNFFQVLQKWSVLSLVMHIFCI